MCEISGIEKKCGKCDRDRKGCFWGGISRDGKVSKNAKEPIAKKKKTEEKRETRGQGKAIQSKSFRDVFVLSLANMMVGTASAFSVVVPEAGPSSHVKKPTKGKSAGKAKAKRLDRDVLDDIEEAEAEIRRADARIRMLEQAKGGMLEWIETLRGELAGE